MTKTLLAMACVFLSGCASYDGRGLVAGQSTEAQVESLMGPSADRRTGPDEDAYRYYPRLPYGRVTYVARFAQDGKLKALEQRLTEKNFSALKVNVTTGDEVRFLLGPPYRIQKFPRMQRDIWEYPWRGNSTGLVLVLRLSSDGVVREIQSIADPDFEMRYE